MFTDRFVLVAVTGARRGIVQGNRGFNQPVYLQPHEESNQNGCLSAADLKWGYDGDSGGHVCENTITSVSRLNHSPLCDDSPHLPPPSLPGLISRYMS